MNAGGEEASVADETALPAEEYRAPAAPEEPAEIEEPNSEEPNGPEPAPDQRLDQRLYLPRLERGEAGEQTLRQNQVEVDVLEGRTESHHLHLPLLQQR
jgi:hypothetical protein